MKKDYTWRCPLCSDPDNVVTRGSQEYLDVAVADHILRIHEERAALRAVDRARITCPSSTCEIGRRNHINLSMGNPELNLSDFDRTLLAAMKVSTES